MSKTKTETNIIISIPTPLRAYTNNSKKVTISANKINNALENLIEEFPKLKPHLFENEKLRNFVNIYLNDEDIRYLKDGKETFLNSGDVLSIIPAIAGGRG